MGRLHQFELGLASCGISLDVITQQLSLAVAYVTLYSLNMGVVGWLCSHPRKELGVHSTCLCM